LVLPATFWSITEAFRAGTGSKQVATASKRLAAPASWSFTNAFYYAAKASWVASLPRELCRHHFDLPPRVFWPAQNLGELERLPLILDPGRAGEWQQRTAMGRRIWRLIRDRK
jgi:hypothetical protein